MAFRRSKRQRATDRLWVHVLKTNGSYKTQRPQGARLQGIIRCPGLYARFDWVHTSKL